MHSGIYTTKNIVRNRPSPSVRGGLPPLPRRGRLAPRPRGAATPLPSSLKLRRAKQEGNFYTNLKIGKLMPIFRLCYELRVMCYALFKNFFHVPNLFQNSLIGFINMLMQNIHGAGFAAGKFGFGHFANVIHFFRDGNF